MVTIESALQTIDQYGGKLDVTTGNLNIPAKILERAEIEEAVNVLKSAGRDKIKALVSRTQKSSNKPYIDKHGVLVIPFESEKKYHWWAGGQTILKTLSELNASPEVIALYGPGGEA
jgi:predicted glycosyl hydrolase (DUF1957 family)